MLKEVIQGICSGVLTAAELKDLDLQTNPIALVQAGVDPLFKGKKVFVVNGYFVNVPAQPAFLIEELHGFAPFRQIHKEVFYGGGLAMETEDQGWFKQVADMEVGFYNDFQGLILMSLSFRLSISRGKYRVKVPFMSMENGP